MNPSEWTATDNAVSSDLRSTAAALQRNSAKTDLQWLLFACLDQSASRQFYVETAVDSLSAYDSRNEPKFFPMSEFIL